MWRNEQREDVAGSALRSGVHLLRQEFAAEGDTPVERDGHEIRAMSLLEAGPFTERGDESRDCRAQDAQQAEVRADCMNTIAIFRTLRAKVQELGYAGKVLARCRILEPRHVLHFL